MKQKQFLYLIAAAALSCATMQGAASLVPHAKSIDELTKEQNALNAQKIGLGTEIENDIEIWRKTGRCSECRSDAAQYVGCACGTLMVIGGGLCVSGVAHIVKDTLPHESICVLNILLSGGCFGLVAAPSLAILSACNSVPDSVAREKIAELAQIEAQIEENQTAVWKLGQARRTEDARLLREYNMRKLEKLKLQAKKKSE